MSSQLSEEELKPYQAVLLAEAHPEAPSAATVMRKLKKALKVKKRDTGRKLIASGGATEPESAFVRYEDRRQVSWATVPILDKVNHLAVVVAKGNWVAIHCTETSRRNTIMRALRRGELGPLRPVRSGHLKAAFMKGPARTLWMRGTHRSTPSKADTKVLGGRDLAPALDPLGDQSYSYTAARCVPKNEAIGEVMGLAVEQSRAWVGSSDDWWEFATVIEAMLDALEETAGESTEPLPVLAVAQTNLQNVEAAYDLAIAPPELLSLGPVLDAAEATHLAELEKLAFGTKFEVQSSTHTSLTAEVFRQGNPLGSVELDFEEGEEEILLAARGSSASGRKQEFDEVLQGLRDPETLTVYFESGHTIQNGKAFTVRHRDIPFTGWSWVPFGTSWAVDREKPEGGASSIGTETSLFDWVLAEWATFMGAQQGGWLACDDRPGETADFLHIDESSLVPILTLVHVKGAKSTSDRRGIAVVPYETVCAQAIKNLRHLDAVLAGNELLSGTIPQGLEFASWQNGNPCARGDFIQRLDELKTNFARRVAIVQPHVRKSLVDEIRSEQEHAQASRLRQLDTLLHGVAANCQSAGADLVVVGAD